MSNNMHEVQIPFTGFYESIHSAPFDDAVEQTLEEYPNVEYDDLELDWAGYVKEYSEVYVDAYVEELKDLGERSVDISLKYQLTDSPEQYNFVTDVIVAEISDDDIKKVMKAHSLDAFKSLRDFIKSRHTSCDGFFSFYSSSLEDWDVTEVLNWDEVQLGTMLHALCVDYEGLQPESGYEIARYLVSVPDNAVLI